MNITISNNNYYNQLIQPILSSSIARTAATTSNYGLIILIQSTANVAAFAFLVIKVLAFFPLAMIAVPDLIGNIMFEANSNLLELTVVPFLISHIVFDCLEDVVIRTNQKILDILHIQTSLPVSHLQLKDTLIGWANENNSLANYTRASQRIFSFQTDLQWEPLDELYSSINNYLAQSPENLRVLLGIAMSFLFRRDCVITRRRPSIDLRNLRLQSLPPIFHYANYRDFSLNLDHNQLTTLPESIFSLPSRCTIFVRHNNFSPEYKESLRTRLSSADYNGPHIEWETYRNVYSRTDISDVTRASDSATLNNNIPNEIVNNIGNLTRSESLITWLNKLTQVKEYHNTETRRMLIKMIVSYLKEANQNEKFRETFLYNVNEGYNSCGDRTSLSILRIDIAYQLEIADLSDMVKLSNLYLRGVLTMDLLAECAQAKIREKAITEQIETYLIYPIKLQNDLKIPIKLKGMLFSTLSKVSQSDLNIAKNYVLEYLKDEKNRLNFLIEQPKWIQSLKKNYKNEMETAESDRSEALKNLEETEHPPKEEYDKINETYKATLKVLSKKACQSSLIFARF